MTQERILPKGHRYRSCPSPQEAVEDIKKCLESLLEETEIYKQKRIKDCGTIEFARHGNSENDDENGNSKTAAPKIN